MARSSTTSFERRLERSLDRQLRKFENQLQSRLHGLLEQSLTQILGGGGEGLAPILGALIGLPQFARGGIADGAQILAIGGEAGPEAIVPLDRAADGSLGLRVTDEAQSSGQNLPPIIINIHQTGEDTPRQLALDELSDDARDALATSLSQAVGEALDQAVTARLHDQLRDGGLFAKNPSSAASIIDIAGR